MIVFLNRAAAMAAGLALLLMAVLGAINVLGTALRRPLVGAHEAIETLMVVAIFLAVAAAQQSRAHISVDLVRGRLGVRGKAALALLAVLCSGAFFALVGYFGWTAFLRSWATGEFRQGQIGFPLWPARLALALGASLMVIQCVRDAYTHGRELWEGPRSGDRMPGGHGDRRG